MKRITFVLFAIFLATISQAQTTHECPECSGTGEKVERCGNCHNGAIYCSTCDYRGVVYHNCYSCNGSGQISSTVNKRCDECNGVGYTRMSKEKPCSCRGGKRPVTRNGRTVYVDCSRCSGAGYLLEYYNAGCRYCGGDGYSGTETVYNTCSSCSGNGSVKETCSTCNGKGCYVCDVCKGYANIKVTCKRCSGTGHIYVYN